MCLFSLTLSALSLNAINKFNKKLLENVNIEYIIKIAINLCIILNLFVLY